MSCVTARDVKQNDLKKVEKSIDKYEWLVYNRQALLLERCPSGLRSRS